MTGESLLGELRLVVREALPFPATGSSAARHLRLMDLGRRDLSLARLAEAHYDAVAILAEAGRAAEPGKIYAVWAAEIPGKSLRLLECSQGLQVSGVKMFASGAGLVDKALVTVTQPEHRLVEIDLKKAGDTVVADGSEWKTQAFRHTQTAAVTFTDTIIAASDLVGGAGWYLQRPGFWHGACGPAACWAGGAEGLVEWAATQSRKDAHTLAHFAAMHSGVWAMRSILSIAGNEMDEEPLNIAAAGKRALLVRHLVEQLCSDILRRFARAYGPYPLAMNERAGQRYQELDLYLRQSHAERDLESLGRLLLEEC